MADPLTTVKALIAKTAPDSGCSPEEIRTAAVIACRLIRENGLLEAKAPKPPGNYYSSEAAWTAHVWADLVREAAERARAERQKGTIWPTMKPVICNGVSGCAKCHELIPLGHYMVKLAGHCWHADCYPGGCL